MPFLFLSRGTVVFVPFGFHFPISILLLFPFEESEEFRSDRGKSSSPMGNDIDLPRDGIDPLHDDSGEEALA